MVNKTADILNDFLTVEASKENMKYMYHYPVKNRGTWGGGELVSPCPRSALILP